MKFSEKILDEWEDAGKILEDGIYDVTDIPSLCFDEDIILEIRRQLPNF